MRLPALGRSASGPQVLREQDVTDKRMKTWSAATIATSSAGTVWSRPRNSSA